MILAIDIGNTHTVLGAFRGEKLLGEGRITSSVKRGVDELWPHVQLFCQESRIDFKKIKGVSISSVVPQLTELFMTMTQKYFHVEPIVISGDMPDIGITVQYDTPKLLGADRLCNVVAAFDKFGGPAIVIDLGTATTYDVVTKKGEYIGGVIAAGVETAAAGLSRRTARLPNVVLQFPRALIGTTTIECIQSGIMYGAIDAMEGMIRRLKAVIGRKSIVVATGGFSQLVAGRSALVTHIEPSLVLQGARLIYQRTTQTRS